MENEEIWKDIPGLEGEYQVSNQGNVRSLDRISYQQRYGKECKIRLKGRNIKPGKSKSGFLQVTLGQKVNTVTVQHLVASAFIGPKPIGLEVRHLNGDPTDNRLENLAYGSHSEIKQASSKQKGRGKKLSAEDVRTIRKRIAAGEIQAQIARDFGISTLTVVNIKFRRTFGWVK